MCLKNETGVTDNRFMTMYQKPSHIVKLSNVYSPGVHCVFLSRKGATLDRDNESSQRIFTSRIIHALVIICGYRKVTSDM